MPTRLKSLERMPPGGWKYRQPETQWVNPDPLSKTFSSTVKLIIAHRRANPGFPFAMTYEAVAWDLENYTCLRLRSDSQWCVSDEPSQPQQQLTHRVAKKSGCSTCSKA